MLNSVVSSRSILAGLERMAPRLPLVWRDLPGGLPPLGDVKQSKSLGARHKAPCLCTPAPTQATSHSSACL